MVDLAGERAHRLAMRQRHPVVDRRQHAIPVVQHIEGDHRRDDHEGEDRDQRLPPDHKRAQERREVSRALADQLADIGIAKSFADDLAQPGPARIGDQRLQARDGVGKPLDEGGELRAENRDDQHDQEEERDHEQADHQERRDEPVQADALQPLDQRIEQIGERHPGDEGQQDLAQEPENDDENEQRAATQNSTCQRRLIGRRPSRMPFG